jgi:hypothetical protein
MEPLILAPRRKGAENSKALPFRVRSCVPDLIPAGVFAPLNSRLRGNDGEVGGSVSVMIANEGVQRNSWKGRI